MVAADPDHSHRYAQRFRILAAQGHDIDGEARLVDAMLPRASRVLDAGCGAGRAAGYLAELDLPAQGITDPFDAIVCAGNVMTFLHPDTRVEVLSRMARHLKIDGRAVIGFGMGRGYDVDDFVADTASGGFRVDARFSTWDLRPFGPDSDFLVAVLSRA